MEGVVGRPSTYNEDIACLICGRMAEGESLRSICRDDSMPALSTVFLWVSKHPEFSEQYTKAMSARADAMFEEMIDIADDGSNDYIVTSEGEERFNSEHVNRSRLRIDTRKWMLSRMLPKKYSDKNTSSSSKDDIDLEIKKLELEKLKREVNPPEINAPDKDYVVLKPDEDVPLDPIL